MIDVVAVVVAALGANSALSEAVGGRVHGFRLPAAPVFPAVVVRPDGGKDELGVIVKPEFEVDVYASTDSSAAEVDAALRDAMRDLGAHEGVNYAECNIPSQLVEIEETDQVWKVRRSYWGVEVINEET